MAMFHGYLKFPEGKFLVNMSGHNCGDQLSCRRCHWIMEATFARVWKSPSMFREKQKEYKVWGLTPQERESHETSLLDLGKTIFKLVNIIPSKLVRNSIIYSEAVVETNLAILRAPHCTIPHFCCSIRRPGPKYELVILVFAMEISPEYISIEVV